MQDYLTFPDRNIYCICICCNTNIIRTGNNLHRPHRQGETTLQIHLTKYQGLNHKDSTNSFQQSVAKGYLHWSKRFCVSGVTPNAQVAPTSSGTSLRALFYVCLWYMTLHLESNHQKQKQHRGFGKHHLGCVTLKEHDIKGRYNGAERAHTGPIQHMWFGTSSITFPTHLWLKFNCKHGTFWYNTNWTMPFMHFSINLTKKTQWCASFSQESCKLLL